MLLLFLLYFAIVGHFFLLQNVSDLINPNHAIMNVQTL